MVITIILVLATVVFVMTGSIRTKAYQANALSAIRQVAIFHVGYATENSGDINTMRWKGDPKEGGGGAWVSNSFWGRFQPFLMPESAPANQKKLSLKLKQCVSQLMNTPDSDTMANTIMGKAPVYHDDSGIAVPFGFNKNLYSYGKFIKMTQAGDPGTILYATYGFGFFDGEDGKDYVPMPVKGGTIDSNIFYLQDRKMLAIFLDGHVEALAPPLPDRNFK